jgi:quinoprotein relay system zinc metallohydrolase 1
MTPLFCAPRRLRRAVALAAALTALTAEVVVAQPAQVVPPAAGVATLNYALAPRQLAPGHWVLEGAVDDFGRHNGCNIINTAYVVGQQAAVVINTGPSRLYGLQQRQALEGAVPSAKPGRVLNLNLHPDYFFGNQAWAHVPTLALPGSRAGMQAEGAAYADNLYRLCGDWMAGTESTPARADVQPGTLALGGRSLELRRLQGHTADDLVVLDPAARVAYVGGLVFMNRVPTTPHARFAQWLASLDTLARWLEEGRYEWVVPSHGPVHKGLAGVQQTRDWLQWLVATMEASAAKGLDLNEVLLDTPIPERFARWAAQPAELHRSLTQWYPAYEAQALKR